MASGARQLHPALTGRDALTPSERRVAQLASGGITNREIAQASSSPPRTVEGHLTQRLRQARRRLARAARDGARRSRRLTRRRSTGSYAARGLPSAHWPRPRNARSRRATSPPTATPGTASSCSNGWSAAYRAAGHRGQGAARGRRPAQGRLRAHPRRRAVSTQRPHPALHPRQRRPTTSPSATVACSPSAPSRQVRRPDQAEGADARPDADLLQGRPREGRDRAGQGQGSLRQARVDQGARRPSATWIARCATANR